MLVLTRRKGEEIKIGHGITLKVVDIKGDKLRLGIEAPQEVPVHRKEIYDRIQDGGKPPGRK